MRRALRALRRLQLTDWAWLQFKIVVGILWPAALIAYPPKVSAAFLGGAFVVVALMTMFGAIISATGLVMSRQGGRAEVLGLTVETVGLMFFLAGHVSYFFTQIAILTAPGQPVVDRIAFTVFVYGMGTAAVARLVVILTARHNVSAGKSRRIA